MVLRIGTAKDIPIMCQIRKQQLIDEGMAPSNAVDEALYRYFEEKIADHSLLEWLIEEDGRIVATGAIAFMPFPPSYANPSGVKGYVTNMYTAPDHRGKGIATMLLNKLMDEARERGISRVWLHASALGKPVYQRFGFSKADDYMEMSL